MGRILVTSRTGFFSRLANLRLLAAVHQVRSREEGPTRVPEEPATTDVEEIHPSRGASIIGADPGHHAESLDAVTGSEFVDDRIRLLE